MANNKVQLADGTVLIDLTADTVTADTLLQGYTAHDASGAPITGTATGGGVIITDTLDSHGGTIREITALNVVRMQAKSVTPTTSAQSITPDEGYTGMSQVSVAAIPSEYIIPSGTVNISSNGTHNVSSYASANVSVTSSLQSKTGSYTPTETAQTATISPDSGYDGLSSVEVSVGAISSSYVGSGITRRSSSDLTASGATVTAPAGYYATAASKAVASGSATAPASISGTGATVSTGTNTLTLTKSVSVTPAVSAGYVSSGTAGNSSVSLTANVTTKAAATITPGTTDQTIAAGTYLTGAQTIAGDADLVSSNILSTANIFGVQGTVTFATYYTGSSAPSSSLGSNGDIYLKTGD